MIESVPSPFTAAAYAAGLIPVDMPIVSRIRPTFPNRPTSKVELTKLRTANARHFLNPDGTFTAEVFPENIHFRDPITHAWTPIDNNLKPSQVPGSAFSNGTNRYTAQFASKAGGGTLTRFILDDSSVDFTPVQANSRLGTVQGNSMTYAAAYPGVDLKYEADSSKMKESIILSSANAQSTFSFALGLNNLTPEAQPDGSIMLSKPQDPTHPVLMIPKPFMYEAGPEAISSQQVTQTVRQVGNDLYLDVTADPAWLKDPARKFPVTIDPTLTLQPDPVGSIDTFTASNDQTAAHNGLDYIDVGNHSFWGNTRGFLFFKPPSLPDGAKISSSQLSLYMYQTVSDSTTVELHRATQPWTSSTIKWTDQPYSSAVESTQSGSSNSWWNFDATALVSDWYNGVAKNEGMALVASPETSTSRSFYSGDHANADPNVNLRPKVTVNYTIDPIGDQSFWKYTGDGVNPFNGNLLVQSADMTTPGRGVPLTVARGYNSRWTEVQYMFGFGWRSTLDMSVWGLGKGPVGFRDALGTRHVFGDNYDGTFSSPPGIHYTLSSLGGTSYKITTTDKTAYVFDANGRLSSITDANKQVTTYTRNASGQVTSVKDPSGRVNAITYDVNGYVDTITDPNSRVSTYKHDAIGNLTLVTISKVGEVPISVTYDYTAGTHQMTAVHDANGQMVTFLYDTNNRIKTVHRTVNGAASDNIYSYGTNVNGAATATIAGPLNRSVTYTFNDNGNPIQADVTVDSTGAKLTSVYTWDTSNHLIAVKDPLGRQTTLDYSSNGKLTTMKDVTTGLTSTQNFDTNNNLLNAKGPKGDSQSGTFDGNNNQTEALDPLGNSSMREFDSYGNPLSVTSPVSLGENLITNPGFEDTSTSPAAAWSVLDTGGTVTIDTSTKSGGNQSLKINATTASDMRVRNTSFVPVVETQSYNLSADVLTDANATVAMRVYWFDSNKSALAAPNNYTGDLSLTAGSNAGWTRKSTQVIPPTGAVFAQVEVVGKGIGSSVTGWFDNVQLEAGSGRMGSNLLVNQGFESDRDANGVPDFWDLPSSDATGMTIDLSQGTAKTGSGSLKISGSTGVDRYVGQRVDITGDKTTKLALSGWAKGPGSSTGVNSFAMQVFLKKTDGSPDGLTTDSFQVNFDPTNTTWHQAAAAIQPTQPFDYIKIKADFNGGTGQTAWFDDFELHKLNPVSSVATTYNYAENSSFERATSSWPDGWDKSFAAGTTQTFGWTNVGKAYTGEHGVSIANPTGWASITSSRSIPFDSTKTYTAVGYAKTESVSSSAVVIIHAYNSAGTWIGEIDSAPLSDTKDWTRMMSVINSGTAPVGTTSIAVGVQMRAGTGTAYFDNVRLMEGEKRSTFSYDAAGNYLKSVKDPLGNVSSLVADANTGNVTSVTNPLGNTTSFGYDFLNRLTGVTYPYQSDIGATPVNKSFTYTYDNNSNLKSATDPNGTATNMTYNELNQLKTWAQVVSGVTQTTTNEYDLLGNLTKVNSPNGTFAIPSYDYANRITGMSFGKNTTTTDTLTYGYDANSNLTSASKGSGSTTLQYDTLNRLTDVSEPLAVGQTVAQKVHSDFDKASNRTNMTATAGSKSSWSIGYNYDERSKVSQITDTAQGKSTWFLTNESGQRVKSFSQDNAGGESTFRTYDNAGHVTSVKVQNGNGWTTILRRYTYDANGNVSFAYDDMAGTSVQYTYDSLNQLVKESFSDGTWTKYMYDELGNRTSTTKSNNAVVTYGYNPEKNRLTSVGGAAYSYDENGNLTSDATSTYTWDNANRLIKVVSGANTYSYTYDALGRRDSKTVNGVPEYYHFDGNHVAYVTDASYNVLRRFTYDASGRPLYMGANGTLYYYHYNAHGDVIKMTDMSGTSVADYGYDAWGNITSKTGTQADANPYRYAGYWNDSETGLYFLNARYYNPSIGRFISQDTHNGNAWQPWTQNLYSYVGNNPVNYTDPTGHVRVNDGGGGDGNDIVAYVEGGFKHKDNVPLADTHCSFYEGCAAEVGLAKVEGYGTTSGKVGVTSGYMVSALTADAGVTWPLAFLSEDFKKPELPKMEVGAGASLAASEGSLGIRIGHLSISGTAGVNAGVGARLTLGGGEGFKFRGSALFTLGFQIRRWD